MFHLQTCLKPIGQDLLDNIDNYIEVGNGSIDDRYVQRERVNDTKIF